ncbi:MAG: DUF5752 family protein [Dissulfurimicrobium sp.]|uniref:DUF5752 family protein n=1 Tax=Dissulfurimicrobium TaxID=1769732 RepID=UPI001ED9CEF9|nr:DUF5752 family protein [Dissulfurimicrobium hydrothermale]UKL13098.1 DUF5752 family protein [Dissulfurimicrobium hydrothermale]
MPTKNEPFRIMDCALVGISTGYKAQNLRELRDCLSKAPKNSIYNHFWGRFLQPHFDEPEYNNDFAAWIYRGLHVKALAEKLSVIDPTDYSDIEALRQELLEVIDEYLDESEYVPWAKADDMFYFIQSQIIIFDTNRMINHPAELVQTVPAMGRGSIFYHYIDARRRTPDRSDDFSAWLMAWGDGYNDLRLKIMSIDPYFSSLNEIKEKLSRIFTEYFLG